MEYVIVCTVALLASGVTLFSGFGLGTILMPALAVFFPVPVAIGATAVVHLANNLFKIFLVGHFVNKNILIRFGVPAVIAALLGAILLNTVSAFPAIASYQLGGRLHEITLVKLAIGLIIVIFSCLELWPRFQKITIDQKYMPVGGVLSGFFGGLSGNQGALRSMFLIKAGISKEEFIATNVVLAVLVDLARLFVYGFGFYAVHFRVLSGIGPLVLAATISAFIGAYGAKELLKKVTLRVIQVLVGVMLVLLGIGLGSGLL